MSYAAVHSGEAHAGRRAAERYGVQLDDELKLLILRQIRRARRSNDRGKYFQDRGKRVTERVAPKTRPISIQGYAGREKWQVCFDDFRCVVIINPTTNDIVTFIPQTVFW